MLVKISPLISFPNQMIKVRYQFEGKLIQTININTKKNMSFKFKAKSKAFAF